MTPPRPEVERPGGAFRSSMWSFLKFAGLSGLGWLLDAALLLTLVSVLHWPAFGANLFSSCTAATTVFLLSRETIFKKASQATGLRVASFVAYSLCLIVVASVALGWLVHWMAATGTGGLSTLSATTLAAIAKVIVTPPQLAMNFLVSRFLSERSVRAVA